MLFMLSVRMCGPAREPAGGRSSSVVLSLVSQVFSSRVLLLPNDIVLMARVHFVLTSKKGVKVLY